MTTQNPTASVSSTTPIPEPMTAYHGRTVLRELIYAVYTNGSVTRGQYENLMRLLNDPGSSPSTPESVPANPQQSGGDWRETAEALVKHNDLLRSVASVCERKGAFTNWKDLETAVIVALNDGHAASNAARAALSKAPQPPDIKPGLSGESKGENQSQDWQAGVEACRADRVRGTVSWDVRGSNDYILGYSHERLHSPQPKADPDPVVQSWPIESFQGDGLSDHVRAAGNAAARDLFRHQANKGSLTPLNGALAGFYAGYRFAIEPAPSDAPAETYRCICSNIIDGKTCCKPRREQDKWCGDCLTKEMGRSEMASFAKSRTVEDIALECERLTRERDQWKANRDNQAELKRQLLDRPAPKPTPSPAPEKTSESRTGEDILLECAAKWHTEKTALRSEVERLTRERDELKKLIPNDGCRNRMPSGRPACVALPLDGCPCKEKP